MDSADTEEESEPLHVYDLPQLYTQPPFSALHSTLLALAITPPTFSLFPSSSTTPAISSKQPPTPHALRRPIAIAPEGIPRYLTSIISSPLSWIPDEAQRSEIRDLASRRLAERAGRTAAPDLDRVFCVSVGDREHSDGGDVEGRRRRGIEEGVPAEVAIQLHEPSLTGDNLGLKTWGAGALLAGHLHRLRPHLLAPLGIASAAKATPKVKQERSKGIRILELGAGTGIVGLAAAAILHHELSAKQPKASEDSDRGENENRNPGAGTEIEIEIHMTDLPSIVSNLARNVRENARTVGGRYVDIDTDTNTNGSDNHEPNFLAAASRSIDEKAGFDSTILLSTGILDWSLSPPFSRPQPESNTNPGPKQAVSSFSSGIYDMILLADPLYSPSHPTQLTNTIAAYLRRPSPTPNPTMNSTTPTPSIVISALPRRSGYAPERSAWKQLMDEAGFACIDSGLLRGREGDGEGVGDAIIEEVGNIEENGEEGEEVRGGGIVVEWAVWGWKA